MNTTSSESSSESPRESEHDAPDTSNASRADAPKKAPKKPKKARRVGRSIRATEAEWTLIGKRARAAGLPLTRYVIERALYPDADAAPVGALPVSLLTRFAADLRALSIAEAYRFEVMGAAAEWDRIAREAEREVNREPDRP